MNFIIRYAVCFFTLDLTNLETYKFDVDTNWMLANVCFRDCLDEYINNDYFENITKRISECDVIINPIANNRMFDIITEFIDGSITNEQ